MSSGELNTLQTPQNQSSLLKLPAKYLCICRCNLRNGFRIECKYFITLLDSFNVTVKILFADSFIRMPMNEYHTHFHIFIHYSSSCCYYYCRPCGILWWNFIYFNIAEYLLLCCLPWFITLSHYYTRMMNKIRKQHTNTHTHRKS